ncbi:MAG: Maf family nucleotide pyrophosphatase [Prevotellaceae bacterium]|jgi:septum formation protein|nr:Maf family nucleotide pyrophosphatase [Prevotellaceae bacterium]
MLLDKLKNYRVILASASPRRKELLQGMGIAYTVELCNEVDEAYPPELPLDEIPDFLARLKSQAFARPLADDELLITADTVVLCNGQALGKPTDADSAACMLQMLSGNIHKVLTGVCLRTNRREKCFTAHSEVTFRILSPDEITYYINTCKPFDKAGAYGVQEWIGYTAIEHIEGSYFNVMGLPTQRLYVELDMFLEASR